MNDRAARTSLADEIDAVARHIARRIGATHKREVKASLVAMGFGAWCFDFRMDLVLDAVREAQADNMETTDA